MSKQTLKMIHHYKYIIKRNKMRDEEINIINIIDMSVCVCVCVYECVYFHLRDG